MTARKKKWIVEYIEKSPKQSVWAIDNEFVKAYVESFNASYSITKTGIVCSSYLKRLMLDMCEEGILERKSIGISGMPQKYPRWTHEYRLA